MIRTQHPQMVVPQLDKLRDRLLVQLSKVGDLKQVRLRVPGSARQMSLALRSEGPVVVDAGG